jgi:hypothetical protein
MDIADGAFLRRSRRSEQFSNRIEQGADLPVVFLDLSS